MKKLKEKAKRIKEKKVKGMQDVLRYRISEMMGWRDAVNIAMTNKSNYNALKERIKERKHEENVVRMKTTFDFY